MNPSVDYTQGRRITLTHHARRRLRHRHLTYDDVWYLLAHHQRDTVGDRPWKREVTGHLGGRTIKVVVIPLADEVRVVTVIELF